MAVFQSFTLAPYVSNDAEFRAWGTAIHNAIAAVGWVQSSDTGQVNWTTVTRPGASPSAVYEIWKPSDALQATDPIYVKIGYYNTTNTPMLVVTFGTATNGTGTITSAANTGTSVTALRGVLSGTPVGSTPTGVSYVMGDESSLYLLLWPNWNNITTNGGWFGVERTRLPDGTPGNGGFVVHGISSVTTAPYATTILTHNAIPQPGDMNQGFNYVYPGAYMGGGMYAANNTTAAWGGNFYTFPSFTGYVPRFGAPSKFLIAVNRLDVPAASTFQVAHYGALRTFYSLGNTIFGSSSFGPANLTHALAIA